MKLVNYYSHLNGYEHLMVHKKGLWKEIVQVIADVDAATCKTKHSKELRKQGQTLYSPIDMNNCFRALLHGHNWREARTSYYVTSDHNLILKTLRKTAAEQKQEIEAAGKIAISSYNQTDFVKDRVQIEVQFGKYAFVAYDLFVKHMAFFIGDVMDVGIEILPMKTLQNVMSSGVPYYEGALYDLLRQGRSTPPVPLVLIGIEP